ncbi:adenosine receptor A2b-like [Montipora foliosa]|uniref:adenosine receptor A2b-like n=1 Tax=Montipora foliosa TaxID=591990 RepID=UPI0035F1C72A
MNHSLENTTNLLFKDNCSLSLPQGIALIAVNGLICVLGTIGNLMVCVAVLADHRLRRSSNYLLFSLAIADLIVTTTCEPLLLVNLGSRTFLQDCASRHLEIAFSISASISCFVSVLHLAAVSVDRFIAVCFSLRHRTLMNNCGMRTIAMLFVSWTIPLLSPILRIALPPSFPSAMVAFWSFALGYGIIIFSYLMIVAFLFYVKAETRKIRVQPRSRDKNWWKEVRVARTLAMVTGVFTVCWVPLMTALFAPGKPLFKINGPVHMWLRTLALSNSVMNFVIYTVKMPDFRNAYGKICKCEKMCSS